LSRIRTAGLLATHAPILTVEHVRVAVSPVLVQVNSTDGALPLQVVHTTFCPGAPHAVVEPHAGTVMPAPLSWVHCGDSASAIGSETLKPENVKTPETRIPKNKIRSGTAIFLFTNLIIAVWELLEKSRQNRASRNRGAPEMLKIISFLINANQI